MTEFDAPSFALQPDISIDYALMERASNVMLVPAKFGWSDVGSWQAAGLQADIRRDKSAAMPVVAR